MPIVPIMRNPQKMLKKYVEIKNIIIGVYALRLKLVPLHLRLSDNVQSKNALGVASIGARLTHEYLCLVATTIVGSRVLQNHF